MRRDEDRSPATFTDPDELDERVDSATPAGVGLELVGVLGEGGMGTVHLARQRELLRDVAVKVATDPRWERALVLEALVAGGLEHPNVPPVHALERTEQGVRLVMRRIDGVPWSELLRDPERARLLAGERELLSFHVGVLCGVTDALSCAHEQGILHRDVKPANVMVGRFGEVYLLDWGVAVALRDDGRGLPQASRVRSVVGTPAYMSPEQARGDGASLGPASDVYMLGASLFEVVAGRAPRRGAVTEQVEAARQGRCEPLPDTVPWALRRLVQASLDPDPARRPGSAGQFRAALVRWLDTRAAEPLVAEARARLADLEAAADPREAERRLVEVRSAFTQALRVDPEHEGAREGLRGALIVAVQKALAVRDLARAAALLAEVADPPDELVAAVEDLSREAHHAELEVERMRAVVADVDVTTGRSERAAYGLLVGAVVGVSWLGLAVMDRWVSPVGYRWILPTLLVFDVGLGLGLLFWDRWWPNLHNRATRQLRYLVTALVALVTAHWLVSAATGTPIHEAIGGNALVSGSVLLAAGGIYDRALTWGGAFLVGAWLVSVVWPSASIVAVGLATALAFGTYAATAQVFAKSG